MADQATAGQPANGNAGAPQPQQQHQEDAPGGGAGQGQANGAPPSRFRQSQYAEAIANPLPELAVVPEPEPVANLSQLDCDDTASSTRAVVQPDDIGDPRGSAVVYAGEKPTLWRKYRGTVIIALVVAVLVLTGIVVGVVVSNAKNRSAGASPRWVSKFSSPKVDVFFMTDIDISQYLPYAHLGYRQLVGVDHLFGFCNWIFSAFYGY